MDCGSHEVGILLKDLAQNVELQVAWLRWRLGKRGFFEQSLRMSLLLLASFDVANFLMGVLQLILEIVYVLLKLTNFIKHDLIVGIRIHFISK